MSWTGELTREIRNGERKAFERVHSLTGQVFFLFVFVSVGQLMDAIDRYRSLTLCYPQFIASQTA